MNFKRIPCFEDHFSATHWSVFSTRVIPVKPESIPRVS